MENTNTNEKSKLTYEQVGAFINSPSFAKVLAQGKYEDNTSIANMAGNLMGIAFDYVDVFGDCQATMEELEDILNSAVRKGKIKFEDVCRKKILRDLGLENVTEFTPEQLEKIDHNVRCATSCEWSKFHAYNGAFDESIRENGITPNNDFHTDEIEEIKQLQAKYGVSAYIKADDGNVAYSTTASVSFSYANTSPEWFSRMCGWAFSSRDYDSARANVEKTTRDLGFSPEDTQRYCDLFEQFWGTFAPHKNYLAIVPGQPISEVEQQFNQRMISEIFNSDALAFLDTGILTKNGGCNAKTPETLNPTVFIEMPNVQELCRSVTQEQARALDSDTVMS